jgi:RHS repeat-associated protein
MAGTQQASFQVSRRFTGQILDAETGLYYYNARYYDPELGRFTQPDTEIPDLSNPQSYNRYSYCVNDPLRYTDPDGHAPLLFDGEAWGELLSPITSRAHNFFLGGSYPVNNERAMLAREGIQQWTPLTDAHGNKLGNPATAVVGAGANALVQAGMMVGPMGEEKAGALAVKEGEEAVAKVLTLDGDKYPVSAANLEEAGAVNKPLTVNRADASANRADALQGLQKVPGHDLDEAPPAMFRQPGDSAVVRPTPPADNRGAGASLGNQARGVPDGGKVVIQIQRKDTQ